MSEQAEGKWTRSRDGKWRKGDYIIDRQKSRLGGYRYVAFLGRSARLGSAAGLAGAKSIVAEHATAQRTKVASP